MRIHRVKPFSEVKPLSVIYPSLHYKEFNCSDAESDIIESHTWGEVNRWDKHVFQGCAECGSMIGTKLYLKGFVVLYVCLPQGSIVKAGVMPCNHVIVKDIIE